MGQFHAMRSAQIPRGFSHSLKIPPQRALRQPLPIACRLLAHACLSLARPDDPPGHLEAKKLAMLFAKLTKKEMTNLQKIVPGMSDYEAWTETMQEYCITPYPPEIPKAEKRTESMSARESMGSQ